MRRWSAFKYDVSTVVKSCLSLRLATVVILMLLSLELFYQLPHFPGLHGDEAWVGIRALDIISGRSPSVHGMNLYSGALFPTIIGTAFHFMGASVLSLRLPAAILNLAALAIISTAFWNHSKVTLCVLVSFASSLFFLFYSRIAWEVTALENLLVALIIVSIRGILSNSPYRRLLVGTFFLAFAFGTWNHIIFSALALSLVVCALYMATKAPSTTHTSLLFLGILNLALCTIVAGVVFMTIDHSMLDHPTTFAAIIFLLSTSATAIFLRLEVSFVLFAHTVSKRRPIATARTRNFILYFVLTALVLISPFNGTSFVGMTSGVLAMERIASHFPSAVEIIALYGRAAVLIGLAVILSYQYATSPELMLTAPFKALLLFLPFVFLIVMQCETLGLSDRYFIVPQMLLLVSVAQCLPEMPKSWQVTLGAALLIGLISSQQFFWQKVTESNSEIPIEFRYGFYFDTSKHFLKLDQLEAYLRGAGACDVRTDTYFIKQPLGFLFRAQPCRGARIVHIGYCSQCQWPVHWFDIGNLP
jgi:hypothetical protein